MARSDNLCKEDGSEGSDGGDGHAAANGAGGTGERCDWGRGCANRGATERLLDNIQTEGIREDVLPS